MQFWFAVHDVNACIENMMHAGFQPGQQRKTKSLHATGREIQVGKGTVIVLEPEGSGALNNFLSRGEDGIVAVSVEVADPATAHSWIEERSGHKLDRYKGFYGLSFMTYPRNLHGVLPTVVKENIMLLPARAYMHCRRSGHGHTFSYSCSDRTSCIGHGNSSQCQFFNAVTGKKISFVDGVEIGRKIWNLDRSMWILQGRHRDMEVHAGYVYNVPTKSPYYLPVFQNGKWSYDSCIGCVLNQQKFEEWKTKFYEFEGWNAANGWPKLTTLEILGLKDVAKTLKSRGKLG